MVDCVLCQYDGLEIANNICLFGYHSFFFMQCSRFDVEYSQVRIYLFLPVF